MFLIVRANLCDYVRSRRQNNISYEQVCLELFFIMDLQTYLTTDTILIMQKFANINTLYYMKKVLLLYVEFR
jgi:hypothetical protein